MTVAFVSHNTIIKRRVVFTITMLSWIVYLSLTFIFYKGVLYNSFTTPWIVLLRTFVFLPCAVLLLYTVGIWRRINLIGENLRLTVHHDMISITQSENRAEHTRQYTWKEIKRIEIIDQTARIERMFKVQYRLIRFILDDIQYDYLVNTYSIRTIKKYYHKEFADCFFLMEFNEKALQEIKKHWMGEITSK